MPGVSVIIPTWNRASRLVRAVSSVLDQNFKDMEVIVVDDGSTDETKDEILRFGPPVRYISHPSNLGVSAARNTGIRASKAPLIAFLDSDDYWLREKLPAQVAFFEYNPDALICQTDEIWIRGGHRVNPKKKHMKPSGDIFLPSLKLCLVSPSAVMLKRSLLDKTGLFDENLVVCEDYDLWLRISCRYPVYLIKRPLVVKTGGHPDQLSRSHPGMDRFRIKSLEKLIKSGLLSNVQMKATLQELALKCRVYGNGCLRRGKKEEGDFYLKLPEKLTARAFDAELM